MKNDMKKRILSAHLALILLLMLWCGTYFEMKESQRQMEQLEASQSESGASNAVEVKRKLMYKAMHTPLGKYPETVTYTLGKIAGANNSNLPVGDTYENNAYTRYLKKILNIQNEDVFELQDGNTYEEAVNVAIEDRDIPDVLVVKGRDNLLRLIEAGMIEDLTETYEECTTDTIKEMYDSYGDSLLQSATVDGKLYFREGGKIDVYEKNSTEKEKITSDVVSYLVYNGKIYYTTTYQMTGKNELRVCDLDGSNDERLTQSVESFCLQNGDDGKLVLVDKMSQDILYSYDLKTRKKEVISCEGGSIDPQYVCFDGDWVFIADDCTISKTNYKTGECVYIWEVPEGKNVNITDVYIHGDKVYFGLYGTDSQTKDDTGLWCVNPDGTDSKKISSDEVNEVCFVGEEYFVR